MACKFPAPNWSPGPAATLTTLCEAAYVMHLLPDISTAMECLLHAVRASAADLCKDDTL